MKGHMIIFEHSNFRGHHRHIFGEEADLHHPADPSMSGKITSFVILEGTWQFFRHADFHMPYTVSLGPGAYPWVTDQAIENDQIASLRCIG